MHGADRGRRQRLQREIAIETPSSELAIGRSKPSAFAVICRSIGKDVPASAAAPSGHSFSARGRRASGAVAAEHFDIGEQMMAEGDRLGRLQMGEARHDGAGVRRRLVDQGLLQAPRNCASRASIVSRTHRRKSVAT
jgi:hypothetical protein